jgi:predicted MFS family arabinose efflux permease
MTQKHKETLKAWQVSLGGICGLVLTLGLARFAYTPLLPSLQQQTGLSYSDAGLLASINYAGYMTGALIASVMDDPWWRHRLYSSGLWIAILMTAAMSLTPWLPAWMVWRFIGGLCGASGMLLGSGLVLGWLMQHGHRPELGIHFMGIGTGIVVTALGASFMLDVWQDWHAHWLVFAAIGLIFFIPAWAWRPPQPEHAHAASKSSAAIEVPSKRWWWTLILAYFAAGWGFVISATFTVAIVVHQPGLSSQGPLAWALVGCAAVPAVFLWDRIARKITELKALILAFGLQAIAVVLPALSDSLAAALLSAMGYGATFIGIVSLTLTLVGRMSPQNPGKAMAKLTLSYGAAQVIAPVVVGALVQYTERFDSSLWLTAGVLLIGFALLLTLLVEPKKSPQTQS